MQSGIAGVSALISSGEEADQNDLLRRTLRFTHLIVRDMPLMMLRSDDCPGSSQVFK